MKRRLGPLLAIAAGVAIVTAELVSMPFFSAHMTDYRSAKGGIVFMIWLTLIAFALVIGGIASIFVRPRKSD